MAEQAATWMVGIKRDAAEPLAVDVWDAVVTREPFVDKRVVRAQQVEQAPILADRALDEHLGFRPKRLAEVFIELGVLGGLSLLVVEITEPEPLAYEVVHQGTAPRIGQQATGLLFEHFRVTQLAALREPEQFVIRNTAP